MKQIIAITVLGFLGSCAESTDQTNQVLEDLEANINKTEIAPLDRNTENVEIPSENEEEKKVETQAPLAEDHDEEVESKKPYEEIKVVDFHEYESFNAFLKQNVSSSGKVNYNSAKAQRAALDQIIEEFQSNLPEDSWSKNQKLAYWINAYNLFTIKFVSMNYPVSSIKDITAKPWDKVFITLGAKNLSLNDIEHKEIRAKFNEPRIHFALNCASESCPILLNRAYKAKILNSQLTQSTKKFLQDTSKNDFSDPNAIKISQLFDWYKTDFAKDGNVLTFINKYLDTPLDKPSIAYLDYSWKLNN